MAKMMKNEIKRIQIFGVCLSKLCLNTIKVKPKFYVQARSRSPDKDSENWEAN